MVLELYLDESISAVGNDPRPLLVLAGYIAEQESWKALTEEWRAILQEHGLPFFHAKDLRSGDAKLYRHLNLDQRRRLLEKLCAVIARHVLFGASMYIRPSDYEEFVPAELRQKAGSAYGACVEMILAMVSRPLTPLTGEPERINVFLEAGHKNAADALDRIQNTKEDTEPLPREIEGVEPTIIEPDPMRTSTTRIGEFGLVDKEASPPVQAADLLAYLVGVTARMKDTAPVLEGVLDRLLQSRMHLSDGWGPKSLLSLAEGTQRVMDERAQQRAELWDFRKRLHDLGLKVEVFPWGITIDGRHLSEEEWKGLQEKHGIDSDNS